MTDVPDYILKAREKWRYRGALRPSFAKPTLPGQESVWDYPRPPRIAADNRLVVVKNEDVVIAETEAAVRVLETASPPTFYLPRDDVRIKYLAAIPGNSLCEWKGPAQSWTVFVPGHAALQNAAWSYEEPFAGFEAIAGRIAFYPAMLECFVGDNRAQPQPGGFYGGWITPEVVGPFKGDPGTEGW